MPTQPLRGLDALAGDAVLDASGGQPTPQVLIVVALVCVDFAGPSAPAAAT
jgi:hypothetical protein